MSSAAAVIVFSWLPSLLWSVPFSPQAWRGMHSQLGFQIASGRGSQLGPKPAWQLREENRLGGATCPLKMWSLGKLAGLFWTKSYPHARGRVGRAEWITGRTEGKKVQETRCKGRGGSCCSFHICADVKDCILQFVMQGGGSRTIALHQPVLTLCKLWTHPKVL